MALIKKVSKNELRQEKHKRIRRKLSGTPEVPRLCVFKSLNHIYAQVIDDQNGVTLVATSTLEPELHGLGTNMQAAAKVGTSIAEKAKAKGIDMVVFDRNGYKYHGCVKALADAAREKGLEF